MSTQKVGHDTSGRMYLARIAATADEEAGNSFNALNQERPEYKEGEERPKPQPQNPVKPMTAEEERLWKDYGRCFSRRFNKM